MQTENAHLYEAHKSSSGTDRTVSLLSRGRTEAGLENMKLHVKKRNKNFSIFNAVAAGTWLIYGSSASLLCAVVRGTRRCQNGAIHWQQEHAFKII